MRCQQAQRVGVAENPPRAAAQNGPWSCRAKTFSAISLRRSCHRYQGKGYKRRVRRTSLEWSWLITPVASPTGSYFLNHCEEQPCY